MKKKYQKGTIAEDIVSGIQSVLNELSDIKKSLSFDQSGPLGVKEAARYLKVSTQKIYLEVEQGDIPFYQDGPGSKIHFFRDELDQWIKQKKRISKKEILDEADNLKFGSHGGK